MRLWIVTLALTASSTSSALAGGIHAKIEGPGPDGVTYIARTYACSPSDTFEPWALAEGVVDGKRVSVLLRPKPTGEHGVYQFGRAWPQEGRWTIRYMLGHPPAPATVATLRADGTVRRNQLFFKSDGSRECNRALGYKRAPGSKDDC